MAAIMILLLLAFMSIFIILELVGKWQVFRKMGIAPWKCLIPYYSTYVAYRAVWSVQFFWAWLMLELVSSFLPSPFALELRFLVRLIAFVVLVLLTVCNVLFCYQLSRAFGEGIAFTVGLFLIPWIFYLILGFSSRMQFRGNRYLQG